jgi:hypothetical protein
MLVVFFIAIIQPLVKAIIAIIAITVTVPAAYKGFVVTEDQVVTHPLLAIMLN